MASIDNNMYGLLKIVRSQDDKVKMFVLSHNKRFYVVPDFNIGDNITDIRYMSSDGDRAIAYAKQLVENQNY